MVSVSRNESSAQDGDTHTHSVPSGTDNALLNAALAYAGMGWHVFPLHSVRSDGACTCGGGVDCSKGTAKHPRTTEGFKDATTDPEQVRAWWTKWPGANIGIATGAVSGIVVLDVDEKHDGPATLDALVAEHGELPRTVTALTGGGGRHYLFRSPEGGVGGRVGFCRGLDVRGDGGYIVATPSLHKTGVRYQWDVTAMPGEVPLADVPEWLLALMRGTSQGASGRGLDRPRLDVASVLQGIPEGQRDQTLYSFAGKLRRADVPVEAAEELMLQAATNCIPPYPEDKTLDILRRVYAKHEPHEYGTTLADGTMAPEVPGWEAVVAPLTADHGMYRQKPVVGEDGKTTFERSRVLKDVLVPLEAVRVGGKVRGLNARLTTFRGDDSTVYLPVELLEGREMAKDWRQATGHPWGAEGARTASAWLLAAMAHTADVPEVRAFDRPTWYDGRLALPGGSERFIPVPGSDALAPYGRTRGDEDKARQAWQEVIRLSVMHPRLAVAMGAVFGSVYLSPLDRKSHIVHLTGESRRGKTKSARVAMAAMGDPDRLLPTWNATGNSITSRLKTASILPVALDETGAAGMKDEQIGKLIFDIAGGVERGRARVDGSLREMEAWRLVVLSTGERGLVKSVGEAGTRSRVLEIQAPMTPDRESIDHLSWLASKHHGWPLVWMRDGESDLDTVREDVKRAEDALLALTSHSICRTLAEHLAMAAAGFMALGRRVGVAVTHEQAVRAAASVLKESEDTLMAEGINVADRLRNAIFEAEARRPWAFPSGGVIEAGGRDLDGASWTDRLGVFPAAVKRIAREIGLADPDAALREMAARGELVLSDKERHLARKVKLRDKAVRMYVVRRPDTTAEIDWTGEDITSD